MNVQELISYLGQYDEDAEVRLAMQPNWPLAFDVANVISEEEAIAQHDERDGEESDETAEARNIVWIAASESNCYDHPYAPKNAWSN